MSWYRTLGPVTYTDGDRVRSVSKAGVRISLTPLQAAELAGLVVLDGRPGELPRATIYYYESAVYFPVEGQPQSLYFADDAGVFYRWVNDEYAPMSGGVDAEELVSLLIVTELAGNETEDTKAPSAKAVYDQIVFMGEIFGGSIGGLAGLIEALDARVTALEG